MQIILLKSPANAICSLEPPDKFCGLSKCCLEKARLTCLGTSLHGGRILLPKVRKDNLSIDIKGEMKHNFILKVKDFFFFCFMHEE